MNSGRVVRSDFPVLFFSIQFVRATSQCGGKRKANKVKRKQKEEEEEEEEEEEMESQRCNKLVFISSRSASADH